MRALTPVRVSGGAWRRDIFKDVEDWDAPIKKKELKVMLEAALQCLISNALLADLYTQMDTDGDEQVTAHGECDMRA
jgi:Ca2+-binding EF-hand superfamily protein